MRRAALFWIPGTVLLGVAFCAAVVFSFRACCRGLRSTWTVPPDSSASDAGSVVGRPVPVKVSRIDLGSDSSILDEVSVWARNPGPGASVSVIEESPDGSQLAWGDDLGDVLVWKIGSETADLVHDGGLGRTGPGPLSGIDAVAAMRFVDEDTLYWMDAMKIVWRGERQGESRWLRKQVNKMGLAWAGEFLEDAFILGVQRRDTLFYNEYVVEKYGSFSLLRNEIQ